MEDRIYRNLRQQLDQYAVGFPASRSGKELEILKKLFTPDEAELFQFLSLKPETAEFAAARMGRDSGWVADLLARMFKKGLVFRREKNNAMNFPAIIRISMNIFKKDGFGCKSDWLLRRRPDIRGAERQMVSQSARIGKDFVPDNIKRSHGETNELGKPFDAGQAGKTRSRTHSQQKQLVMHMLHRNTPQEGLHNKKHLKQQI